MRYQKSDPSKRTADGIVFDSIAEMERCEGLKLLQRDGIIREVRYQTHYDLVVNDLKICTYTADFTYIDAATNQVHVEDVKGFKRSKKTGKMLPRVNREFGIKKKLMKALFDIDVEVV